jgi:ABC-type tungstate transport system permease subunit
VARIDSLDVDRRTESLLDPVKHPEARREPAQRLADWLTSADGQAAIGAYTLDGEQLFTLRPTRRNKGDPG